MSEIEVKATRSFEHMGVRYTRGRHYQVDTDDRYVLGLIAGKYLVPADGPPRIREGLTDRELQEAFDAMDNSGIDEFLGSGVGVGMARPEKQAARKQVSDGTDEVEQRLPAHDPSASDASGGEPLHP